jgi:hypothetical protein
MTYSKVFSVLLGAALIFSVQHAEAKGEKGQEPEAYHCDDGNLGEYSAFCPISRVGFCPGMDKLLKRTKAHLHSKEKVSNKTIQRYLKNLDSLEKDWKTLFNNCMTKLANQDRVEAKHVVDGKGKKKK